MTTPIPPRVGVIIVAAGDGVRLGEGTPKAFVEVASRPILGLALDSVFGMLESAQVIVVAPPGWEEAAQAVLDAAEPGHTVVAGGPSRQESVAAGLARLAPTVRTVVVHDAARPFAPVELLREVIAQAEARGHGVVPGLPLVDTVKRTDATGDITATVDRSVLTAVQTPQAFPTEHIVDAYARALDLVGGARATDDAALVSAAGYRVSVIPGDPLAFKITTPWDLRRAEELVATVSGPVGDFRPGAARVGVGTDSHGFDDSRELWLAGLFWPGESGLAGHSDGDAVTHAVVNAALSAAGLGDIGTTFGTADPRFAGAHADAFLPETRTLVEHAGFVIGNVSVQVSGNRPRLAPRRAEAEAMLSGLLGAPVTLSAGSTDGLGFTGRGEGVSVTATALVYRAK
ncbi:MAG: 2-C-methyl-D-erythritol 4-phosphate cytidylyltransferase [Microbacteriaceae bacterium]